MKESEMNVIRSQERGSFNNEWLKTFHSFSFAGYHNPERMNFGDLRAINEDFIQPGEGFDPHLHKNMEIITYVSAGALAHRDSIGNGSAIYPSEVQYMSAGAGVTHSEYNSSEKEITHIHQIWIVPNQMNAKPRYDQKAFRREEKKNRFCRIASPDGREGSISIRQDAHMFATVLESRQELTYKLKPGRKVWIQVIKGNLFANGEELSAGDGVGIPNHTKIEFKGNGTESEFLLFDLR